MRRNRQDAEPVVLIKFGGGGPRRGGHAAELRIAAENVLERDRGKDAPARLDGQALFRLQRRLETVRQAAIGHDASREFVDELDAPSRTM